MLQSWISNRQRPFFKEVIMAEKKIQKEISRLFAGNLIRSAVEKTNRKVLLEYLMIEDINDHKKDAKALAKLVQHRKHLYHVNVIKYHDTGVFVHTKEPGRVQFVEWLREEGVLVTHRRTFGEDISAADSWQRNRSGSWCLVSGIWYLVSSIRTGIYKRFD